MTSKVGISLAASALADLADLAAWYESQEAEESGTRLLGKIMEAVEMLSDHPRAGRVVPEFQLPTLREILLPPFRIVYRHEPGRLRVVRVWRSERLLVVPGIQAP